MGVRLVVDQAQDEEMVSASLLPFGTLVWCRDSRGVLHLRRARIEEDE